MKDGSWHRAILSLNSTIQDAIRNLNDVAIKIILVVDEEGRFLGTISDGDIRRGLLRGLSLADSIGEVIHRNALVLPPAVAHDLVMRMMAVNKIQQIPVVDEANRLVGLHLWDKLVAPQGRTNLMVIMAGGKGTRLLPHTEDCPKPMLLISGKPMLEHIIQRAKLEGFVNFILAILYLGHIVEEYFGDGSRLGVHIDYLREQVPLGTAGALSLLTPRPEIPFVVSNGDVLTDIRYGELLDFHCLHGSSATMAVRVHEWQHPFGVVQIDGVDIVGFNEKPVARSYINAGVYALEGSALDLLKPGEHCDMPELFKRFQGLDRRTVAYPMHESWLDVGRPEDLKMARDER